MEAGAPGLSVSGTGREVQQEAQASGVQTDSTDDDVIPRDPSGRRRTEETQAGSSQHTPVTRPTKAYYTRTRSQGTATKPKRDGYLSDLSSEDDYNGTKYVTGLEESSQSQFRILPFHSRPTGPPHKGLGPIKPANKRFDNLMSYRSYRLRETTDTRSSKATAEVRPHLKNLSLTLGKHKFDGTDPYPSFRLPCSLH